MAQESYFLFIFLDVLGVSRYTLGPNRPRESGKGTSTGTGSRLLLERNEMGWKWKPGISTQRTGMPRAWEARCTAHWTERCSLSSREGDLGSQRYHFLFSTIDMTGDW